jgi:5-methylcytosine-specific restriction endonuclease McrA
VLPTDKPLTNLVEANFTLATGGSERSIPSMSKVFVVDATRKPLPPVHAGYARLLLTQRKAAVLRRFPFTLILKAVVEHPQEERLRVKLDPGSKTTGLAIVNETTGEVVFAAEIRHRGAAITKALSERRRVRRSRRNRHTRYRKPRFANRKRRPGWLAPSLESRVCNVVTWVKRLLRLCPIAAISQELARFDMQAITNPEIQGINYQHGTLFGYEVRQYLLEKWDRTCAYCGKKDVPLQIEHIVARANGGTDRISNLCLSCEPCNQKKGTQDIGVFLKKKPTVLNRILAQAKAPLKDAAAVNSTRWELCRRLQALGLPLECGTGGRTKWNRVRRGLGKTHWLDAACVGASTPETLQLQGVVPLLISATGHGCRQKCLMNECGFPRTKPKGAKKVKGFQTGDIVRAVVRTGTKVGTYTGRVAIRTRGSFTLSTACGTLKDISHRWCRVLHHCDGYSYQKGERAIPPAP